MADGLCSWFNALAWRANYLAWHRRVTGRLITGYAMPFEERRR